MVAFVVAEAELYLRKSHFTQLNFDSFGFKLLQKFEVGVGTEKRKREYTV